MELYRKVLEFAKKAHEGQVRKDGKTAYINHPIEVSSILKDFRLDDEVVLCAALLHDVIEDTKFNTKELLREELVKLIGDEDEHKAMIDKIVYYVDNMTNKFSAEAYPKSNRKSRKKKEIKAFKEWVDKEKPDEKLIALKLADIISNMSNVEHLDFDFGSVYILEELHIVRALKIDLPIWNKAVETVTCAFKEMFLQVNPYFNENR